MPVLRLDDGTGAEAAAALLLPEFFDGDRLDRRRLAAAAVAGVARAHSPGDRKSVV